MAKPVKVILIALAVVILLLVSAMALVETRWARGLIEDQVSQRLGGREVSIGGLDIDWGWPLGIHVEDIRIANPPWAEHEQMAQVDALDLTLNPAQLAGGSFGIERIAVDRPVIHLARQEDGTSNWAELMSSGESKTESEGSGNEGSGFQPGAIELTRGQLTYQDAALGADVSAEFETTEPEPGQRRLRLEGQGTFQGKPLEFSVVGEPPSQALADTPYAVTLNGHLGQVQLQFDGQAQDLLQFEGLQGQLSLSAPETAELALPNLQTPLDLPAFDLTAQLQHQAQRWALEDLLLQTGGSRLTGELAYEQGQPPRFDIQLQADQLDLNRWGVMPLLTSRKSDPEEPQDEPADPVKQTLADTQEALAQRLQPLQRYRGQVDIGIDLLLYGEAQLSDVAVKGQLEDGRLQIERLHLTQGEGELTAQGALAFADQTLDGQVDLQLDQVDLGQALSPFGYAQLGTVDGELHARFADDSLILNDTQLAYSAPAQDLELRVSAESRDDAGLDLEGSGTRNGAPFEFDLASGPLLELFGPEPFPIQGSLSSGETTVRVDGSVSRPLELGAVDAQLSIEGSDPARLSQLTGVDLPTLPAYRLEGNLHWEDPLLRLQDVDARLGGSDLSGDVRVRMAERPMLWATLYSRTLNLDDVTPPEATVEEDDHDRVFPDDPLDLSALHRLDARVVYEARNLNAAKVPLEDVELELELEQGLLTISPLQLGLGGGEVSGQLRLDAGNTPLAANVDLSIAKVNLSPLLRRAELPDVASDSAGVIGGRVDLDARGQSVDALMASLDGNLELAMSQGYLDMLVIELLGLDAGEALVGYLADADRVPMRCAYFRLDADSGLARLEQFFIGTSDSNITGGGSIDLSKESLDLAIEAHPKDVSFPATSSPIQIQGALGEPQVSVTSRELLARGIATVVGALVAPPLAILPWVEPGLGEGEGIGCQQALAEF